ncbi:exo-alpha-sialidase [Membranihabitans maritimus]|uniref:exo-alpha-sialidase n=1 Tax=Membranihabitans maritimus TaxID=2904244 RepID=UPI001F2C917B|nr:exo-alpha-sialidase [Membranihabitans maritimus]
MNRISTYLLLLILGILLNSCSSKIYPDAMKNPESPLMFQGKWFDHPHNIEFDKLPVIPSQHVVVSNVQGKPGDEKYTFSGHHLSGGVNQHNYLIFHDGKFWLMWSDGPGVEDRVGQVVKYATSPDGLTWTEPKLLTPYPPGSGPNSEFYNTRTEKGMRWIARGFWLRNGELLALASLDEAAGFFGPSLELRSFTFNKSTEMWEDDGQILDNAINNFPPKKIPSGEWMMSRRSYDYKERGVDFMVGGLTSKSDWEVFPVLGTSSELSAEEPYWWVLPDGKSLMALFRDNRKSGYLYRAFSTDNGRTWSKPVKTNFPDARSKFHGLRLSDGRYILVSNPNPEKRDPIALSISDDGIVFNKMGYLKGGRQIDYPNVIEHNGHILIAFAGSTKQKIEVLKIKISDLDQLDMKNYPTKQ